MRREFKNQREISSFLEEFVEIQKNGLRIYKKIRDLIEEENGTSTKNRNIEFSKEVAAIFFENKEKNNPFRSEFVLLEILKKEVDLGLIVLMKLGADLEMVRHHLKYALTQPPVIADIWSSDLPSMCLDIASYYKSETVKSEHLIYVILMHTTNNACRILGEYGVDLFQYKDVLEDLLREK